MYIFEAVRGWDEGQRDVRDEMHLYVHIHSLFGHILTNVFSLLFRCDSTVITKLFPHSLKYSMTCDNAAMSYGLFSLLLWLVLPAGAIYEHELHCLCLRVNYTAFM